MTTLEKVQALLPEMTYQEKLRLLGQIAHDLSDNSHSGIEHTPGVCGGVACIADTRIPVWALVGYKTLGASDADILQPILPLIGAEEISNAWAYYHSHKDEIDQQIAENELD